MSRVRRDHRLVGAQRRRHDRQVGLGAPHEEMHVRLRAGDLLPDERPRAFAVRVGAVAVRLVEVGVEQRLHDAGVRALAVIVLKAVHVPSLPLLN